MWESKEKYEAYVAFRADSKEENEEKGNFQTAPPTMKIMPVIINFNKLLFMTGINPALISD